MFRSVTNPPLAMLFWTTLWTADGSRIHPRIIVNGPSSISGGPKGTTANTRNAGISEMMGPRVKMSASDRLGMMSSLATNLRPSAIGWSSPCQPTRMGPSRTWM